MIYFSKKIWMVLILSLISLNANDFEKGMIAFGDGNFKKAEPYLEKVCNKGDANACATLGQIYLTKNMNQDLTKPLKLFYKAYKEKHLFATATLGSLHLTDKNSKIYNYQKGITFFKESCDGGLASACTFLGIVDSHNINLEYIRKGCDYGDAKGCMVLGSLQAYQNHNYLKHVCEQGNYAECCYVAILYHNQGNQKQFKYYFEKSCDGGNASACAFLGGMYGLGDIKIKDSDKVANELLKQACDKGSAHGCNLLGARYENGRGISKNKIKAKELFKQSCMWNDTAGCVKYIKLISREQK